MKSSWTLVIAAAAVVLFLAFLSSTGRKPPQIPSDGAHADRTTNDSCVPCHAPGKSSPLKSTHPPKEQCVVCHRAVNG